MTKEELRKSLDFVCEERERLQQELQRKDNIINELKKLLEIDFDNEKGVFYSNITVRDYIKYILDKIKELENDNKTR